MGARADRRPSGPLRSRRAWPRRCAHRRGVGERRPRIVEEALAAARPAAVGHLGYRIVDEARIGPRSRPGHRRSPAPRCRTRGLAPRRDADVGVRELALRRVARAAARPAGRDPAPTLDRNRRLSIEDTWRLINAPVDEDNAELLATLALAVSGDSAQRSLLTFLLDPARLRDCTLEDAEQAGRTASILRWFALQYPVSGASRSSAPPRSRRQRRRASSRDSASRCRTRRSAAAGRAAGRAPRGFRCAIAVSGAVGSARRQGVEYARADGADSTATHAETVRSYPR